MNVRLVWKFVVLTLALFAAEEARAEEGEGFSLGLRSGFGISTGRLGGRELLPDEVDGETTSNLIPLQVDAGYFLAPRLYVGGYFQYGAILISGGICDAGLDCSASQLRFGIAGTYSFRASPKTEPWLGLSVGYELSRSTLIGSLGGGPDFTSKSTSRGFEFGFQGGLDYRLTPVFSVGPYANFTLGQFMTNYSKLDSEGDELDFEGEVDVDDTGLHTWLTGGLRLQARFF